MANCSINKSKSSLNISLLDQESKMDHKFHNHSLRKNNAIEDELKSALSKIEKQKQDNLMQLKSKRDQFKKLHSRHRVKRSLDLDSREYEPSTASTTLKSLDTLKDSTTFSSEPNLFARKNLQEDRKPSLPFLEPSKCLPFRKIRNHGQSTRADGTLTLDSSLEGYHSDSNIITSDSQDDTLKTIESHLSSCNLSPIFSFPFISHNDSRRHPSRAKLCISKAMQNRVSSDDAWKYLMTNVFKRLNDSSYKHGTKEDSHCHNISVDDIALCRYLRLPVKSHVEADGDVAREETKLT